MTIKLEKRLLEAARVLAATRGTSLSGLFAQLARNALADDAGFRARRKRFRDRLEQGFMLNTEGQVNLTRADLHDR